MTEQITYPAPLDQLAALDELHRAYDSDGTPDLVQQFGLTDAHVPDLIRMAHDLENAWDEAIAPHIKIDAPYNAVYALGQLGNPTAIEPLLDLHERNEVEGWGNSLLFEDVPAAIAMMGESALDPVAAFLADLTHSKMARVYLTAVFGYVVKDNPQLRDRAVELVTTQLQQYALQEPWVNADLVIQLVKMNGVESAEIIESAFAADKVDISLMGDWEDVQIELGLLEKRITPKPDYMAGTAFSREKVNELRENLNRLVQQNRLEAKERKQFKMQIAKKKKAKAKRRKKRKRR